MGRYCLIGFPTSHSLSPTIMNYIFERNDVEAEYDLIDVNKEDIGVKIQYLRERYDGFNVTMPLKEEMLRFVDRVGDEVELIGSINTVRIVNRRMDGYNTDWIGVKRTLDRFGIGDIDMAMVIGAGGAGKAAIYALKDYAQEIIVVNRTYSRALETKKMFERIGVQIKAYQLNLENLKKLIPNSQLVINATPVGMNSDVSIIPGRLIRNGITVFDMVYRPLNTRLLREASNRGAKTIDGLWMLIYQAIEAVRIWLGINEDADEIRKFLEGEILRWRDTANHLEL